MLKKYTAGNGIQPNVNGFLAKQGRLQRGGLAVRQVDEGVKIAR
jgi:hypothetical protein